MEKTIRITLHEYESLKKHVTFMEALCAEGVENWGGYERAIERYNQVQLANLKGKVDGD